MTQHSVNYRHLPTLVLLLGLLSSVIGDTRPDLPFIGCAAPEGSTQRCYFYVQEEKTWKEAEKACRAHKGAYLATVPDYQTRIFLSEAARPRQDGVWIGGVKEAQNNWRWNTGRTYLHKVIENRTEPNAELCGYVNATNPTVIQTAPCTTKLKYICSESEMLSVHDPHYVSPWKHTWTWFSAKIDCLNRGMDLAVLKEDNLDIFRQLVELEEQQEEDHRYWVGLSTSRYIWHHTGKEMDHILFGCGEPSHSTERCIEMMADGKYNDTRCEEKRPFICEWVKKGHELLDIGCLGNRCFYYVDDAMTWGEANRTCRNYIDTALATIPDYHTQFYLNSMVTKLYLTKRKDQSAVMGRTRQVQNGFWLGGRYKFAEDWTFMDGETYKGVVNISNEFSYYHCGSVTPGDDTFHGLLCDERKRFLCLTTDPNADALKTENYFISAEQTQVLDWFKARTDCLDRGMDLASGSMDLLQQILTGQTGSFWVGLTKSGFVWEHTDKPIIHMQFRCDEPNNYQETDEHCMEMWLDGEYNDNICNAAKPMVCEWDRAPVTPPSIKSAYFTPVPPTVLEPQDHTWMYAAISVAILGVAGWAVAIVVLAFSMKMYKTNLALKKQVAAINMEMQASPGPNYRIELENEDDPELDDILNERLHRILLDAAPDIHRHLPLSTDPTLWARLRANNVVDQVNQEYIQGNKNSNTNVEQLDELFKHLQRGTNRRYYTFRAVLLQAGYDLVVRLYLDRIHSVPGLTPQCTPSPPGGSYTAFQYPPVASDPSGTQHEINSKEADSPCNAFNGKQSGGTSYVVCGTGSPPSPHDPFTPGAANPHGPKGVEAEDSSGFSSMKKSALEREDGSMSSKQFCTCRFYKFWQLVQADANRFMVTSEV